MLIPRSLATKRTASFNKRSTTGIEKFNNDIRVHFYNSGNDIDLFADSNAYHEGSQFCEHVGSNSEVKAEGNKHAAPAISQDTTSTCFSWVTSASTVCIKSQAPSALF